MSARTAFEKRIRRNVTGRVRDYFVALPPNLEPVCLEEIRRLPMSGQTPASTTYGGILFQGRFNDCCLANLHLRTANRILMRVASFKASSFSRLEKKCASIPWELFLPPGTIPGIHVTTTRSRLIHSEAVAERVIRGIGEKLGNTGPTDAQERQSLIKIFVRAKENRFTLSIDSSGDHLYQRGVKKHGGRAPLRETIAAAGLLLSGYTGEEPLMDPMCGSGTFSLEAAMMAKRIPPGWFRRFAFMEWPAFVEKRFGHLKKEAEKGFRVLTRPSIFASDRDKAAGSLLEKTVLDFDLGDAVAVSHGDFFETAPKGLTQETGLVAINPPYGRRMGTAGETDRLMAEIGKKLRSDYSGWKVLIITPKRLKWLDRLESHRYHQFVHGGLRLYMAMGRVV
jgi:putative N6-adenine-specific DNA methylase